MLHRVTEQGNRGEGEQRNGEKGEREKRKKGGKGKGEGVRGKARGWRDIERAFPFTPDPFPLSGLFLPDLFSC
jgi:hypothetical protein